MLRVIAGEARSVPLVTVEGSGTRPTTDRIKETLFNIIQSEVEGARVLDLFAGSGQIGIEALSRGAESAVFVENDRKCVDAINQNLKKTKLFDRATVLSGQIPSILKRLEREEPFDIAYIDPPYDMAERYEAALKALISYGLITENSVVICECVKEFDLAPIAEGCGFEIYRQKDYKTNRHYFLRSGENKNASGNISGEL